MAGCLISFYSYVLLKFLYLIANSVDNIRCHILIANNVDPNQMPHSAVSDLGLPIAFVQIARLPTS